TEAMCFGLISVFHSYSGKEGDKYKLSKGEMKNLLQGELIMGDLDENKDGEVDFQEFIVLVAALSVACHEFFKDCDKSCVKDEKDHGSKKD
uniref:Protein S100 n=1 Tax=Dicentrarchus labrax TaxID=13489 RepID=A0A8C4NS12_DICLA